MNYTIMALLGAKDIGLRATMARASGDVQRFSKQTGQAGQAASKFGSAMKAGFLAAGAATVVFFGQAISKAIQFETAMRNVNSIAGLSERGFKSLSAQVLQLSTTVPQSANTLAEGLYDIVSSGFAGAGALNVLEQSAIAATAGMTTTDVASRAIAASINAYGLSAADAADISDILFQTVNLGVISFEQLASGLGNVVGGAAAAGVELDEVGAAIAAMTLSGLGAEESITSLNRLLEKIIKPSDALSATFQNLGYESGKAALDANGLHGTMELLRMSTGGQVTALLELFPEIRAARGAFALMAADGQNYARTFSGITDETARAGAAQRAYAEQSKALSVQWDLFVSSFNAFSIQVGTALLPALKSGLAALTDFGTATGRVMSQLGTAAAPMIRSLGDAFQEVARLAGEVYDAVQPVVKVLAAAFAVAAIAGLRALAEALAAVAGALADHPGLVQAVAFAIGGLLLSNLITAGAAAAKFAIQFRALLVLETLGPILSTIGGRLQMFGAAMASLRLGNLSGAITGVTGAFQGLGGALKSIAPTATMAAALLMIYRYQDSANKAKAAAQEMRQEIEADIDPTSVQSIRNGIAEFQADMEAATAANDSYGGRLRRTLFETAEVMPGLGNSADDTRVAMEEAGEAADEWRGRLSQLQHDIDTLSNALGISADEATEFLSTFEDYDPTSTTQTTSDLAQAFRDMAAGAAGASPATETLDSAMADAGNLMSTAADKADAFNNSLDALLGTMLGASDASIAYQQAIDDLTEAFSTNGDTLDINTQAGRDNASAINSAVSAAVEHAAAVVDSTGSMQQGVDTLGVYREQLLGQLESYGLTREAAESYLETIGLTPENLTTLIELAGTAEATTAMGQVFDAVNQLDLTVAEPSVELDDLEFMDNAAAVGEFLVQVGMAAPSASVTLDDSQFTPTAEQVTLWSETYDDSTPQAVALLNIIDPQNNFSTLSEAAAGWDAANPTATVGADASPAINVFAMARANATAWGLSTSTSTVAADSGPANTSFSGVEGRRDRWDASTGTATAGADTGPANSSFAGIEGRRDRWDSSSGSAAANLIDNASGPLNSLIGRLNALDGRSVTTTVTHRTIFEEQRRGLTTSGPQLRMGGITNAQTGLAQAGVFRTPTVYFAEPATGGEAFIPKLGNYDRSMEILAQAASWYGATVIPKDAVAAQAGAVFGAGTTGAGVDLRSGFSDVAQAVWDSTNHQIRADSVHHHHLLAWLGTNVKRYLDWTRNGIETLIRMEQLGAQNVRWFEDLASIPANRRFADGGTVPGRIGQPQVVLAHGGETITPPGRAAGGMVNDYSIHMPVSVAVEVRAGDIVDGGQQLERRIGSAVNNGVNAAMRELIRQQRKRPGR